jgi:hypothetical protein
MIPFPCRSWAAVLARRQPPGNPELLQGGRLSYLLKTGLGIDSLSGTLDKGFGNGVGFVSRNSWHAAFLCIRISEQRLEISAYVAADCRRKMDRNPRRIVQYAAGSGRYL